MFFGGVVAAGVGAGLILPIQQDDAPLTAFRQVEDAVAANHHLSDQIGHQRSAADAAQRTSDLALTRYRDGASDYLEVVTAQTDALDAQRAVLIAQTQRMRASVALVRGTTPLRLTPAFAGASLAAPPASGRGAE